MSIITRKVKYELLQIQAQLAEELLSGSPKDYAAYKALVGRISGIRDAITVLENVVKDDETQGGSLMHSES